MSAPSGPSDPHDPPRWHEDPSAPSDLAADLRAARRAGPSPAQIDAIAKSIQKVGAPAASDVPPAPNAPIAPNAPPPTQAFWQLGAKFWMALIVPVCVAAFLWGRMSKPNESPVANDQPASAQTTHTQSSTPPVIEDAGVSAALPAVLAATPEPPRATPATDVDASAPRAEPRPCNVEEHHARISQAQSLVASGDHRAALATIARDRSQCPRAAMSEDRERLAIEALFRAGSEREARARWSAFQRSFPRSLYTRPLGVLLASQPR